MSKPSSTGVEKLSKTERLLNDLPANSFTFVLEGVDQPPDELQQMLQEINRQQIECAKARKKCREGESVTSPRCPVPVPGRFHPHSCAALVRISPF